MTSCERVGSWLDGYHDGELGALRRWWVGRHLAGCTDCRAEVSSLARLGDWMRDAASSAPAVPDLWAGVAARLPLPEPRVEIAPARTPVWAGFRPWSSKPFLGGALATAAVAAVLVVHPFGPAGAPHGSVVRSINSHGRPVIVLEGNAVEGKTVEGRAATAPTIIWMMDAQHDPNPEEVDDVTI
jgi:anti-sigma factor RsiW